MKLGAKGLELIKSFEGFSSKPYLDIVNVPTIGYGTTVYPNGDKVKLTDNAITNDIAERYLEHHINQLAPQLEGLIKAKLNQNQWDAIYSFVYNLGIGNFRSSTLLKKINANPNEFGIRKEFMKWVYAGGKISNGLMRRRKAEQQLYFA